MHEYEGEMDDIMTAMEVVRKFSISYQTLNHYTNFGLLNAIRKTGSGNKRFYNLSEVEKNLNRIGDLKGKGYPLKIIAKMLNNIQ
ncbi:MAG: MerR family transcriptional regulator, partial [Candidatus Omnitrophica bacterium]|nr:MerR family transcriptional regulator [Candidatus Omnitrophota bacterium]